MGGNPPAACSWKPEWVDPKVAIVLVHYERPDQTLMCIESLRLLTYANFEIIVVDNCGVDGLQQMMHARPLEALHVLSPRNGGYSGGNNVGIREALARRADFVHVLNPDTVVLNPDYLSALVKFLERSPRVAAVGPKVHLRQPGVIQNTVLQFPWLWRRIAGWARSRIASPRREQPEHVREAEVLNGVCVLFRAVALQEIGLLDEATFAYIEDVDWSYRAEAKGWRRVFLPVDSVVHMQKLNGYEHGSMVDYLLKRNTLYFLLKTNHYLQALAYTMATLLLGIIRLVAQGAHPRSAGSMSRWLACVSRTYLGLWTGRWQQVMGPPEIWQRRSLA